MSQIDEDTIKRAVREVLREWLEEKYAAFGKWSLMGLGALFFVSIVYFIVLMNGWHK